MRFTHLEWPSTDVDACVAFFRDVLQLEVQENRFRVGWTGIAIVPTEHVAEGALHLAFNVPFHRFDAACAWLADRALVLSDVRGEARFHLDSPWDSRSVYFAGPHDAVLELIAREALASEGVASGPFHGSEILCVSEVGLPTDDVPALARELVVRFGIAPFGEGSDVFAPMGGHEGLLILVDRQRFWFPELRQRPAGCGVRIHAEGVPPGSLRGDQGDWSLNSTRPAL